jgi:DNA-binding beta-propeller fold protein YncE
MNVLSFSLRVGAISVMLAGAVVAQNGEWRGSPDPLIVTSSNTATNKLLVYDTRGTLLKSITTDGQGGVTGNAGGIAQDREHLAVVNFGSGTVSVFAKDSSEIGLRLEHMVPTLGSPVSVAFGHDHLYILTTTHVESHRIYQNTISATADGSAALLIGDGSAAQVGVLADQLIFSEKSNAVETVNLDRRGGVDGRAKLVSNIPTNVNAPFGLVTRGNEAYVTIAHANEISLVRDDTVLTTTGSGTQSAPCWLALDGPFLFSSNSPSHTVSRYAVYGRQIIQDAAVVATFAGDPTDIAYSSNIAAVVDADTTRSRVSIFEVDEDGNLARKALVTIDNIATNGVAIVEHDSHFN